VCEHIGYAPSAGIGLAIGAGVSVVVEVVVVVVVMVDGSAGGGTAWPEVLAVPAESGAVWAMAGIATAAASAANIMSFIWGLLRTGSIACCSRAQRMLSPKGPEILYASESSA
jgi:hypothetical protein